MTAPPTASNRRTIPAAVTDVGFFPISSGNSEESSSVALLSIIISLLTKLHYFI